MCIVIQLWKNNFNHILNSNFITYVEKWTCINFKNRLNRKVAIKLWKNRNTLFYLLLDIFIH